MYYPRKEDTPPTMIPKILVAVTFSKNCLDTTAMCIVRNIMYIVCIAICIYCTYVAEYTYYKLRYECM